MKCGPDLVGHILMILVATDAIGTRYRGAHGIVYIAVVFGPVGEQAVTRKVYHLASSVADFLGASSVRLGEHSLYFLKTALATAG
jgi:hypothetical protein